MRNLTIDEPGVRSSTSHRARRSARTSHPRSVRFRNAVRGAIGLGGAVLLAKALNVEHGFWVVLGTLTVLRSNAIGTRRTAVQALLGTLLGFALASALIGVVSGDTTGLWIAFPVLAFLSAYTPAAVNFVVGQASFTVLVVVLFNLVVPEGWRTGLVRLQDIAVGAAISVVVGLRAVAPRRGGVANADVRRAARDRRPPARRRAGPGGGHRGARPGDVVAESWAARDRALEALEQLAAERGIDQPGAQPWASLLIVSTERRAGRRRRHPRRRRRLPVVGLPRAPRRDRDRRPEPRRRARGNGPSSPARLDRLRRLCPPTTPSAPAPVDPRLGDALTQCAAEAGHTPVQLLWAREWLEHLGRVLERTRVPSAGEQVSS